MQDDVKAVELAPCLCGRDVYLFRFYSRPDEEGAHITIDCAGFAVDECPLNMMLSIDVACQADVDAAIMAWNTRPTLATLQERCERLEAAARAALPWVTSEEHWSALAEALGIDTRDKCIHGTALEDDCDQCATLTPDSSGAYSMSPEDTDPARLRNQHG